MSELKPKEFILEKYNPALDELSPKLKDMDYPGIMIVSGNQAIIYSYTDLDVLFNKIVATKAKQKK
jgi:hypothetical protein